MGLFVFLLIMLAAAWGMVLQLGGGPLTAPTPPSKVSQQRSASPGHAEPVGPASTSETMSNDSADTKKSRPVGRIDLNDRKSCCTREKIETGSATRWACTGAIQHEQSFGIAFQSTLVTGCLCLNEDFIGVGAC